MAFTPYNFPNNPFDGQLYPDPPVPGTFQYQWVQGKGVWVLSNAGVIQVLGNDPIVVTGTASVPVVNIRPATTSAAGSLSAADKQKLDSIPPSGAGSVTRVETGVGLTGGPIVTTGTISLRPPVGNNIGGVKAGAGVTILSDGTLEAFSGVTSVTAGTGLGGGTITSTGTIFLRPPANGAIGGVKAGTNIYIDTDGTINAATGGTITGAFGILDDISPFFDGIQRQFELKVGGSTVTVTNPANLFVVLGGILQPSPSTFSIVNNQDILFVSPPPPGATFSGRVFVPNGQAFQQMADISSLFNGVQTRFPIEIGSQPYAPASEASLFVSVGGLMQTPGISFTVEGNEIVFASPPLYGATFSAQILGV
jgi:hypothetical protein